MSVTVIALLALLMLCQSCAQDHNAESIRFAVVVKLEGSVRGPWVEELRKAWLTSTKMAGGDPVSVDMGAVSFLDGRGRDLLLRMRREGVALNGGSSFLGHILQDGKTNSEQLEKH